MSKAEQTQTVAAGTDVIFKWWGEKHDVWLLPNKAAYDACDFSRAKYLPPTYEKSVNQYTYKTLAAGTFYFGCKVNGHCKFAQMKLALTVTGSSTGGGGGSNIVGGKKESTATTPFPANKDPGSVPPPCMIRPN